MIFEGLAAVVLVHQRLTLSHRSEPFCSFRNASVNAPGFATTDLTDALQSGRSVFRRSTNLFIRSRMTYAEGEPRHGFEQPFQQVCLMAQL